MAASATLSVLGRLRAADDRIVNRRIRVVHGPWVRFARPVSVKSPDSYERAEKTAPEPSGVTEPARAVPGLLRSAPAPFGFLCGRRGSGRA